VLFLPEEAEEFPLLVISQLKRFAVKFQFSISNLNLNLNLASNLKSVKHFRLAYLNSRTQHGTKPIC
jgi:hypothetical protein